MALVPVLFRNWIEDCLEESLCSARFSNKRFRSDRYPEKFLLAVDALPRSCRRKRGWHQCDSFNEDEQDGIVAKKSVDEFQVHVDVQHFKPDELSVKATDKLITVEGKHEQKDCDDSYVFRHFVRRYQLPDGHDKGNISSTLSSDGVLTISAPKLARPDPEKERSIPVKHTKNPKKVTDMQGSQKDKSVTLEDLE